MKNRAKCKLCLSIIESFHPTDYVLCKCGEIAIDGGQAMRVYAKNFDNFLRIDEEGNEFQPTIQQLNHYPVLKPDETTKLSFEEKRNMLKHMIYSIERLPQEAITEPVSQYDLWSALMLIEQIFDDLSIEKNK